MTDDKLVEAIARAIQERAEIHGGSPCIAYGFGDSDDLPYAELATAALTAYRNATQVDGK